MKILLIGGTRFLGRHICQNLVERGHLVVLLNRGTMSPPETAARLIKCDKNDRETLKDALLGEHWDVVIDTILSDQDLEFVIPILEGKIVQFIHCGSIGVYLPSHRLPARESHPLRLHDEPFNFNAKLLQDQVVLNAHATRGFPCTILRMSIIYGAGDVPLDGWGGRQPGFFLRLLKGKSIPLPNEGRALVHPGHVTDLARAFGDVLERPGNMGQVYNICGERALPMAQYIRVLAASLGVEANLTEERPEAIRAQFPDLVEERRLFISMEHGSCDIAKAEKTLGWHPTVPLEVGLADNMEWMRREGLLA